MYKILPIESLKTQISIPSDKSISHRALLISALSCGVTKIFNFLNSNDTLATLSCIEKFPIKVEYARDTNQVRISSSSEGSLFSLSKKTIFSASESGTTIRLLSGILSGQPFPSIIKAAPALSKRPMKRITVPLRLMGAKINGKSENGEEYPPLEIAPVKELSGITYIMPQASAQVKSAILFASLFSKTPVRIKEPYPSRDHTERMLLSFGARIKKSRGFIVCERPDLKLKLKTPGQLTVPGDFSSAAFFLVLGALLKNSEILLKNVGINPTRTGLLGALRRMGARIRVNNKKNGVEPYADILVKSSELCGITVKAEEIPLMIDEIPVLMVAASFARGTSGLYGLKELKVKETDRIHSMVSNLQKAGVDIVASPYA